MSKESLTAEKKLLRDAEAKGGGTKWSTYAKLSGPGWLQGAITLGGGSLAGSLYLGVIGGYQLLWLQPLMMIFGILMLSVIGYVALSTGEKPFQAINKHINPVLGWGWLIAALMANLVWAMPQFSLGTGALQDNLGLGANKYLCAAALFIIASVIVWLYDSKGVKIFETILKLMVGVIVLSFFGVVAVMASKGTLPWNEIFMGFIPDFSLLSAPADKFEAILKESSDPDHWRGVILGSQRDRMVTAAATAVGINMTFLLPYSMLRKGWGREHRGLATFDLSLGLFIPFLLATSCVVIASASQFHGEYDKGLLGERISAQTHAQKGEYKKKIAPRLESILAKEIKDATPEEKKLADKKMKEINEGQKSHDDVLKEAQKGKSKAQWAKMVNKTPNKYLLGPWYKLANEKVPEKDREIAAMLVPRDSSLLAGSLEALTGKTVAQSIFGIGVVGMAVSTIIILMLINGFCLTEAMGLEMGGTAHKVGSLLPGITGALGFLWLWGDADAKFWLAVPTSIFGMVLLPVAYFTFFCMINSKSLLGDALPTGGKRVVLNIAIGVALVASLIGALWSIWSKLQWIGLAVFAGFIVLVILGQCWHSLNKRLDHIEDAVKKK